MDYSLSDYIDIPYKKDGDKKVPKDTLFSQFAHLDKPYQAHQLLVRNMEYMDAVCAIRKKYGISQYDIESDNYYSIQEALEEPKDSKSFDEEIRLLANRIRFPGEWFGAVKLHVLGITPEGSLMPVEVVEKIIAKKHDEYVEVRIYGDLTQLELRSSLKGVRELMCQSAEVSESESKYKPQLDKNLLIYDLAKKGWSYAKIAKYCDENKIQRNMQESNVGKYIALAEDQIARIVA